MRTSAFIRIVCHAAVSDVRTYLAEHVPWSAYNLQAQSAQHKTAGGAREGEVRGVLHALFHAHTSERVGWMGKDPEVRVEKPFGAAGK